MLQYDVICFDEVEYVIINTTSYNLGLELGTLQPFQSSSSPKPPADSSVPYSDLPARCLTEGVFGLMAIGRPQTPPPPPDPNTGALIITNTIAGRGGGSLLYL